MSVNQNVNVRFKNGSKLMQISLSVLFMLVLVVGVSASQVPVDVMKAAQEGLPLLLPRLAENVSGELGHGFQVYTITPQNLLSSPGSGEDRCPMWEMPVGTGVYRFVVKVDGAAAALLTVANVDGRWQAVGIGAAALARDIDSVRTSWPQDEGFKHRFIRIFQAKADFIEIQKGNGQPGYAPMISARVSLKFDSIETAPSQRMFQSEILEPLREIVSHTLKRSMTPEQSNSREK